MVEYHHGKALMEMIPKGVNSITAAWLLATTGVLAYLTFWMMISPSLAERNNRKELKKKEQPGHNYPSGETTTITPLTDFNYRTINPIDYRPFKTMQHVSMGIKKMPKEEWIRIDRGYLDRIEERKQVMQTNPKEVFGSNLIVDPAIAELYEEVMDLLPRRYPTMFELRGKTLHNKVTNQSYSVDLAGLTPLTMLRNLGENVEEDFYIMCPDAENELRLQGYIACFPGGFLSPSRVGMSMREIHQPVPGFEARIGKGADRFLVRLEPGVFVGRMNWSLQTDGRDLFRMDGNNFYPEKDNQLPLKPRAVNLGDCYLRVEHQTLTRLARSRAVIFCVRSYMTSLQDVRAEGNGPALADAIESMPEKLGVYKMRPLWSEAIYPYLRQQQSL
ncbi:hypothetical protein BO86DRAFT_458496 [Aspergillus japonicus CBS 114.51]|uniref:HRQ family protein n=1 Tax=Aspergillus japonicus CBS 114.51 TaxID=1448312 RepID=A0A8T8WRQ5_ASPJA|nr:hypothetical protein BO86DRAFT_458496 [Aspergillus japonicus CBS 114.51]RAH78383.1 hypothetical protein BO86DRAFT_458496 [Aspergillus japonicus CBS 114.51]